MISEYELGSILAGRKRAEGGVHHIDSAIILGEAVEDSSNGKVRVVPYGDVFNPDGDNTVTMTTSPSVKAGDTVQISLVGGVSKRPMVVAVGGSGDRLRSTADAASQAAAQAASAVSQVQQDIADFKSGADVDYAIYEYVDDEVGELSTTVSATYLSKTEAQTTYATQSQLTQTAESIEASVSQDYVSKSNAQTTYATKSELNVGLEGIELEVAQNYATKDEAATTGEGSGESVEVASGSKLRSLTVEGKSVQDGTPAPDAPVPIQVVDGANLFPSAYYRATYTSNGITVTNNEDGTFTLNGTATAATDLYLTSQNIPASDLPIIANKEYRLLGMPSNNGAAQTSVRLTARVRKADESGNAVYPNDYGLSATFTTTVACYVQAIYVNVASGTTLTNLVVKPQVSQSSVTDYVPYGSLGLAVTKDGTTTVTPIPLQGNVLASLPDGTKDVLMVDASGHVTVQRNVGYAVLNGSETWNKSSYVFYTYALSGLKSNGAAPNAYNSAFRAGYINAASGTAYLGMFDLFSAANPYLRVSTDAYADTTAFKAWLATVPMQVVYPLATPTTIDLGYIAMPELADGCTVQILASLTPTFGASWYTENGAALADFATKSELTVGLDRITAEVSQTYAVESKMQAALDSLSESFNGTMTAQGLEMSSRLQVIQSQLDGHEEVVQDVTKSFSFSQNGLVIGASNSQMRAILDNDALRFQSGGTDVLVLDATSSTAAAERMSVGKYQWRSLDNGDSMALVYTG